MAGLRRWTAGGLDLALLEDVSALSELSSPALRGLGRLPEPVLWRSGQAGFTPLSWDDAIKLVATRVAETSGGWTLSYNSAELSNEAMFCFAELARSGRAGHVTSGLSEAQREGAAWLRGNFGAQEATASLEDLLEADTVVVAACDLRAEPLLLDYLAQVGRSGGQVVEIGPGQIESGGKPGNLADRNTMAGRTVLLVGPAIAAAPAEPADALWSAARSMLEAADPAPLFIPVGWPPGYRAACDLGLSTEDSQGGAEPVEEPIPMWFAAGNSVGQPPSAAKFRVHQIFDLDPSVLLPADEAVLLLPMQSRFEISGGGTYTSMVGRVRFSPEIRGHQIGVARPDWWAASHVLAHIEGSTCAHEDGDALRRSLAQLRPAYAGTADLFAAGEGFVVSPPGAV